MNDVKSYALLMGSEEEVMERANVEVSEAKLKVGDFSPSTAKRVIEKLLPRFRLRLDFNRKWALADATALCQDLPLLYVEEPALAEENLMECTLPFAIDETLRECALDAPLFDHPNLKALIVKPTLQPDFEPLLQKGIPLIISSNFDPPEIIEEHHERIRKHRLTHLFHGLDTLRYTHVGHDR